MNVLSKEKQIAVLSMLVEGCSVRAIERMTGVQKKTTCRLLARVGEHCKAVLDEKMRALECKTIHIDEIWTFVKKKQRRVLPGESDEIGDQYTFVAMDSRSKLVASFLVGKRTEQTAHQFLFDLSKRLSSDRVQVSTDGFKPYRTAVPYHLRNADFAQVVKSFSNSDDDDRRYSPPSVCSVNKISVRGYPYVDDISTSHIERQNLTMRMHMRRFTRLSNAFSKKLSNLKAAVCLHFAWYNLVRVHQALRITPAMAAGVTSRIWKIENLLP